MVVVVAVMLVRYAIVCGLCQIIQRADQVIYNRGQLGGCITYCPATVGTIGFFIKLLDVDMLSMSKFDSDKLSVSCS